MRKSLNIFISIACNSMIAPRKQRQEHNNLAAIQRAKLKVAYDYSKSLEFVKLKSICKLQQEWTR
jgi:hypothetical protein